MPAGAIDLHQAVSARCDVAADFAKMLAHCLKVDGRHDDPCAHASGRAPPRQIHRPRYIGDRAVPPACYHVWPTPGSTCPADRPWPHPATKSRAACRQRAPAEQQRSERRSFFVCLLGSSVLLGMERPRGQLAERQPGQQLAYAAFMILHGEIRLQTRSKIAAPPTNNAVMRQIGTLLDQRVESRKLRRRQPCRASRTAPVG